MTLGCVAPLSACSSTTGQRGILVMPGVANASGGFGQGGAKIGRPITVSTLTFCVKGAPVQIQAIRLNHTRAIKLIDWGWRVRDGTIPGGQPGVVRQLRQGFTQRPVDVPCRPNRAPADLDLTVERVGPGVGAMRSYTVVYAGGSLVAPFGIALCPARCTRSDLAAAGG
jgi:hypothetical protein